jgi:hypothetical protein
MEFLAIFVKRSTYFHSMILSVMWIDDCITGSGASDLLADQLVSSASICFISRVYPTSVVSRGSYSRLIYAHFFGNIFCDAALPCRYWVIRRYLNSF